MNSILEYLPAEKKKLRLNGIKLSQIHHHRLQDLQSMLGVSKMRAMELSALSEFQSLPSIGIRFAQDLISLGYYSLKDLKGKDPARLTNRFERQEGVWIDPCVEDQFRLVVHYANHPGVPMNWWDFTNERKAFREKHGYPSSRPTKAWYELERYKLSSRIGAKGKAAKVDLHKKLKLAVQFMNQHLTENLSLTKLADVANLSPFHFHRLFKEAYSVTPLQQVTHLRLKKASRLLKSTGKRVSEIGHLCGFDNESSFVRLFKRELGITPLVYRKRNATGI
jgi:AraC-like DNA-binding protein